MGYAVYEDRPARSRGVKRWAGYGVPAVCDQPDCNVEIDRGMAYRCEEWMRYEWDEVAEAEGEFAEEGCGLHFCGEHESHSKHGDDVTPKPDVAEWVQHMLTDKSWSTWRTENPGEVERLTR